MAFIAIPGLIALVSHSSGGAILSTAANGYLAGSLIPASVVAGAPLAALGAVLVVGVGSYFYLHGIPVPIAEILAAKGLGTSVASGSATATSVFAVSPAQIVAVLLALAAVSYIAYTHSGAVKNAVDTATKKAKASTIETVVEIREALERVGTAASECTNIAVKGAKATVKNVAQAVDQVADKAKEGAATTVTHLKETFDQNADKMDSAWHDFKKHLVPNRLKS